MAERKTTIDLKNICLTLKKVNKRFNLKFDKILTQNN